MVESPHIGTSSDEPFLVAAWVDNFHFLILRLVRIVRVVPN